MATLAGNNLTVDGTAATEVITSSNPSATLTDSSSIGFYRTATPSGAIANQTVYAINAYSRNQSGTQHLTTKRWSRTTTTSGGSTSTFGILFNEIYVSNVLNAYTQLQQDAFYFYSSYSGSSVRQFHVTGAEIGPGSTTVDNTMSAGAATRRYTIVYATTGTINTSDVNEKEQIAALEQAELRVASSIKGLIKKFKWKDAVAKKGDAARIHVGVIAQEVEAAFVAEGLDPEKYAIFCKDVWWEKWVSNPDYEVWWEKQAPNPKWVEGGNEPEFIMTRFDTEVEGAQKIIRGEPETLETFETEVEGGVRKERKGIRYDQLLSFVIAAL